jgi:hypothetical protein
MNESALVNKIGSNVVFPWQDGYRLPVELGFKTALTAFMRRSVIIAFSPVVFLALPVLLVILIARANVLLAEGSHNCLSHVEISTEFSTILRASVKKIQKLLLPGGRRVTCHVVIHRATLDQH